MNLSFSGCGFLGIYHVGVASCLREYAPHLVHEKIAGASAGSLAACALLTGCSLGECTSYVLSIAVKARSRALGPIHPSFNLVKYLRDGLYDFLPDNAHEIATGHLFVSLTRVSDRKNILISHFDSKDDLIQALTCSAFVPFYSGLVPPKYHGVYYVDGGITNNIPILDKNTITVSPFAGESDICPDDNSSNFAHIYLAGTSIQFTASNMYRVAHALFPPNPEVLSNMCQQGFDDALRYLQRNNLIGCTRHLNIYSSIRTAVPIEEAEDEEEEETLMYDEEDYDSSEETDSLGSEEGECEDECCYECKHRRHLALLDSLPPQVVHELQAACDSVNGHLLAPLYNLQLFRMASLLFAPFILPLEVTIVLATKIFQSVSLMPLIGELGIITKELYEMIQTNRHRYSARFTCQLAIIDAPMIDVKPASMAVSKPTMHRRPSVEHIPELTNSQLNVGFSVDFQTHYKNPLRSVGEVRHRILDHDVDLGDIPLDIKPLPEAGADNGKLRKNDSPVGSLYDMTSFDTFEDCLYVSNQMDSILSYYYSEEDDPNTVKIMEIFPLKGELPAHTGYVPVPVSERKGLPPPSRQNPGMDSAALPMPVPPPTTQPNSGMKRATTYAAPLYDAM